MPYPSFKIRSSEKELLDAEQIPQAALFQNLAELHTINRLLGGYKVLLRGLAKLVPNSSKKPIHILDLGSGGGDSLATVYRKFHSKCKLKLTGIDLKADCIQYAQQHQQNYPIDFIQADYRQLVTDSQNSTFDIIMASLFCHHLSDEALVKLLRWMSQKARLGFIINDLDRHPVAYHSIHLLTQLFSKSYLVRHDAPLSVRRGFKRAELKLLLEKAELQNYELKWCWAFRWLIIVKTSR